MQNKSTENSVLFLNRLPAVDNIHGPPSVVMKLDVEGRFEVQHLAKMCDTLYTCTLSGRQRWSLTWWCLGLWLILTTSTLIGAGWFHCLLHLFSEKYPYWLEWVTLISRNNIFGIRNVCWGNCLDSSHYTEKDQNEAIFHRYDMIWLSWYWFIIIRTFLSGGTASKGNGHVDLPREEMDKGTCHWGASPIFSLLSRATYLNV